MGKPYADFTTDQQLQDAVLHNLEVLGSAAKDVLREAPQAAQRFPQIPFQAIYGMRNWLPHGYFSIDEEMVWKTVGDDLEELRREVLKALAALEDTPL